MAITVFFAIAQTFGALVEVILGIDAENKPLEDVAVPLSFVIATATRQEPRRNHP